MMMSQEHQFQRQVKMRLKQNWKQLQDTGSVGIAHLPTETSPAQPVRSVAMQNRLQADQGLYGGHGKPAADVVFLAVLAVLDPAPISQLVVFGPTAVADQLCSILFCFCTCNSLHFERMVREHMLGCRSFSLAVSCVSRL